MTVSTASTFNRSQFGRRRFGDLLVSAGMLTEDQFESALSEQLRRGGGLNEILVRQGWLTEEALAEALSTHFGLTRAQMELAVDPELLVLVPRPFAETHDVVPLACVAGRTLIVATSDPLNFAMIDWLRTRTGCYIEPHVATPAEISRAITKLYGVAGVASQTPVV